jgi:uncharacterized membrane protein YkgB
MSAENWADRRPLQRRTEYEQLRHIFSDQETIVNADLDNLEHIATRFLQISLGVILGWIGAGKFVDPSPVVMLLSASMPIFASATFVYLLGAMEIIVAIALFANVGVRYAGIVTMGLFAGTLTIFLIAPMVVYVEGRAPLLALPGQFLLKDLALFAAAMVVAVSDAKKHAMMARPARVASRAL